MSERRRPTLYGAALVALTGIRPFVAFLDVHRGGIIHPGRVVGYALLTCLLALAVLALVVRWRRRAEPDRLAVVVAVVVTSFFSFSSLFDDSPPDERKVVGVIVVWLLLTVVVSRLAYLASSRHHVRFAVAIFVAVLAVAPSVSYATYRVADDALVPVAEPEALDVPEVRPNVYWLVLDGYARPDALRLTSRLDPGPFVADLEGRGFQVSQSSYASYPRTHVSLASTLEMDYVVEPGDDIADEFGRFGPIVIGNNATVARFRALGYQSVYGEAGGLEWATCRPDLVDVCLPINRPTPSFGEVEQALLDLTPLGALRLPVPYGDPLTMTEGLVDPEVGVRAPFFAFQHVLGPHWPYRYRDDCSARTRPVDIRRTPTGDRVEHYRTQVRCLNDLVLEAVDEIEARDPTAVIVIQSDHGSDHKFTWTHEAEDWTPLQVNERYGAFNAMRLPDGCASDIEGQPLVNTFRVVFACIEGREPDLLDYRGFTLSLEGVVDVAELAPERFSERSMGIEGP